MLESLLQWDRSMMVLMNAGEAHGSGLDIFMWMSSQILVWLPVLIVFIYIVAKNKKKEAFLIIGSVVLLFLLCDQITSSIMKPVIARLRPSRDPLVMDLLQYVNDYRGGQFGFPSSHAANSFGFALLSSLFFRYRWYTVVSFLWAGLCAYSRIYLGVHFPLDILCGIFMGILLALFTYWVYLILKEKMPGWRYYVDNHDFGYLKLTGGGYKKTDVHLLLWTLIVTLFIFFCAALEM